MTQVYQDLYSSIDLHRSTSSINHIEIADAKNDPRCQEFLTDMLDDNDTIELNLIKNGAYKEGVILTLAISPAHVKRMLAFMRDEQKTFGGSKLFYINDDLTKLLILSVKGSLEGKLSMVLSRLSKTNEKIGRLNTKIKRENSEAFAKRQSFHDKKDIIVNLITKNLKH